MRAFAPGETTIVVSPSASMVIRATPVGCVDLAQIELDAGCSEPGECLRGERITADRSDQANIGTEARAGNRLVGSLAARKPIERCPADSLAGTW